MTERVKNLILMHFVVLIFGFTGILGKLITIEAVPLVFWRTAIGAVTIYLWLKLQNQVTKKSWATIAKLGGVGILIAIHWVTFFASIKASNVSIALTMLAVSPMFVGFLEPVFFRRKIDPKEIFIGSVVIVGVAITLKFSSGYEWGVLLGLISALFASLFATINGVLVKEHDASNLSLVELFFASLVIFLFMAVRGEVGMELIAIDIMDWVYITILAVVATSFAFIAFTHVLKVLTPFTTTVAINLEPIYSIILAVLIFGEEEIMGVQFYIGATLIIGAIIINTILKEKK
ncbi:MAG TPA: DMT family transporter [Flavobacteriales bacterium]|nr:DMT family transporter [Flavobacteriales bacterium]